MKIATKTGDFGETGLLYGQRVSKTDLRIAAVGAIDEACAFIGLLRAGLIARHHTLPGCAKLPERVNDLINIQKKLIASMGEVVTDWHNTSMEAYSKHFDTLGEYDLLLLDEQVQTLEAYPHLQLNDWVIYGSSELGARADVASKVVRRAELSFLRCKEEFEYRLILGRYLNRLSDYLFLLARQLDYEYSEVRIDYECQKTER